MRTIRSFILGSVLLSFFSPFLQAAGDGSPAEVDLFGRVVRSLRFEADRPLDPSHYRILIPLEAGDPLTRTALKESIQALFDSGQFSTIAVEAEPEDGGVLLRFVLQYNYYFNTFRVEGDFPLGGRTLRELVPLPIGERYTAARLEDARQAVIAHLLERGYYLAEVRARTVRDEENRQVDTVFETQPGERAVVGSVEIAGVPEGEAADLLDKLGLRRGTKFDRQNGRRRLEALKNHLIGRGYLAADPQLSETFRPEDNTVALVVRILNYGRVRVTVEGYKIPRQRQRRLLPVLSGEGLDRQLLEEGVRNIKDYMEEEGYPGAEVSVREDADGEGTRTLTYLVVPGPKVTVAGVEIRGNRAFTDEQLLGAIQIQPSRFLQRSVYSIPKLDADVETLRTLYHSRGYLDAEIIPLVEPLKGGEKLHIVFVCEENQRATTKTVTIDGNRTLDDAALRAVMSLRPGGPYSTQMAEQDRLAIIAAYNDAGFFHPRVSYSVGEPDDSNAWPVEFEIQEGLQAFVDDVIVLGNDRTRSSVIQKRILLRGDEPLSLGKMLRTQRSLYDLGVFELVRVAPQNPDSIAPYQKVVVRVEEARQITTRYGIGYQERERLRGIIELSHLNLFGSAQRADLRLRGSNIEQAAILSLQQPKIRFLPVDSFFTFSARKKREVSFDATRLNLSYQYSNPAGTHSWMLLRYNFRNVRVSNLKVSMGELEREDTPRNLSTVSAIYINDTRDNYLDPQKGFFTSTDVSVTTKLLGSSNFVSLFTQNHYYRELRGSLLFSGSFRFGAAKPFGDDTSLPISERFFAGGGSSLRGFATDRAGPLDPATNNPLGGQALLIGNLEVRIPLLRAVHLAGFYDTGNVFRTLGDIGLGDFSHTLGLGIRIRTPFGPIRIDYGFNLNLSRRLRDQGFERRHLFVAIGPPF